MERAFISLDCQLHIRAPGQCDTEHAQTTMSPSGLGEYGYFRIPVLLKPSRMWKGGGPQINKFFSLFLALFLHVTAAGAGSPYTEDCITKRMSRDHFFLTSVYACFKPYT